MQLKILSIYPERLHQTFRFNWKNMAILCLYAQHTIATISFLLIQASTFAEFSEAFFSMMTEIFLMISYSLFVLDGKKIHELIDNLDQFTETRQISFQFIVNLIPYRVRIIEISFEFLLGSKQLQMTGTYEQINKKLNKLTFSIHFALNKITIPIIFGSNLVANYLIFFFTDSSSFQLPAHVV